MQRTEPPMVAVAVCLAALAGYVDAIAFTSLGGFFASFMSGNSTLMGVGLGTADASGALTAGGLIMSFVGGVILASAVVRWSGRRHAAALMTIVTVLLASAAVVALVAPGPPVLILLATAMGVENGVFHRDGEVTIGVTYLTGTLVRMGQKLAGALMGDPDRWGWVPYLALWLGFVAGVVSGAASQTNWGWHALWLAAAVAALLAVVLARIAPRQRPGDARIPD